MFRKLLLGSVAGLALLTPLAFASNADAHVVRRVVVHEGPCRVYYHDPCRPGWVFGGTFRGHDEAVRFAAGYRARGFAVSIR
jgi:hypothetical protein